MAAIDLINEAFRDDLALAGRVQAAIRENPEDASLYLDIANYVHARVARSANTDQEAVLQPLTKKRKTETPETALEQSLPYQNPKAVFIAKDLSFSIPMRKKLHLEIALDNSVGAAPRPVYQIRARNPTSTDLEYKVCMQSIKHALRLPVPEKVQRQYNFVLLQEFGLGIGDAPSAQREPLVWTVNDAPQKIIISDAGNQGPARDEQDSNLIESTVSKYLEISSATKLVKTEDAEFVSATPEAHRKGEKAYHVTAYRGSKEGYLFFLASGIFFGFKKPLSFFPIEAIHSVSYTSVLQRTFNLVVSVQLLGQADLSEHEFSMLDQANFSGIDTYIKRHELHDASLAESRKAQKGSTGTKRTGDQDDSGNPEQSELEKAQQEIEDAEDEEEEDYDPGSEGASDGSGSDSEEETDDDAPQAGGEMIVDELGSEREEIEPDVSDNEQL